jgi:hypothetical protein
VAEHNVFLYKILTDRGSVGGNDFTTNKLVKVVWNDTIPVGIKVYLLDDINDPSPTLITSGPSMGLAVFDHQLTDYYYRFCSDETAIPPGPNLNKFNRIPSAYPYSERVQTVNSSVCQVGAVCDVEIQDNPTITSATDAATNDGSVTIIASSSNGTMKAALFDFAFITQGTVFASTITFSNLFAGTYTIWVKDEIGCVDTISVNIPLLEDSAASYGQKYFMEWSDNNGKNGYEDHKIEVYKKEYGGSVSEMKPYGEPFEFQVHADSEDKFHVIRATSITFSPISVTDGQYQEFFTEDEREFLVKYYLDTGAGYVLKWQGFVVPFLYQEPHLSPPYPVSIQANCGLANLKDFDFVDASGNNYKTTLSAMSIIASILKKLDLPIAIRSGLNIYEENFDATSADDPLTQAYYDTKFYYSADGTPEKCDVVIKNILKEYSATISQSEGVWTISRPEELISAFDYRQFTSAGQYDSNDSMNPVYSLSPPTETSRFAWKDRLQHLELLPSYGTIRIIQNLLAKPSLLYSYSFEIEDFAEESNTPRDWNVSITEGSSIQWGRTNVSRGDSRGALLFNFGVTRGGGNLSEKEVNLYTVKGLLDCSNNDTIVLKFDYLLRGNSINFPRLWYRLKFKLKVGTRYFDTSEEDWTEVDPGYQNIYLSKFEAFDTFEISLSSLSDSLLEDQAIELYFVIDNGFIMDYTTLFGAGGLEQEDTVDLLVGEKRLVSYSGFISGGEIIYLFYELEFSDAADSGLDVVRPDDFDGSTNPKVWRRKGGLYETHVPIYQLVLDNVVLKVLPDGLETPSEKIYSITTNPGNKRTLDVDISHGDYPPDIVNAKHAYRNIIKRLSGTDYIGTQVWARSAFSEGTLLQNILLSTLVAQFRRSNRRLTGNLISDIYLTPCSVLQDTEDSNRLYLVQGYTQLANLNEYTVDLYELKNAEAVEDVVAPFSGAFNPQQFGISYD